MPDYDYKCDVCDKQQVVSRSIHAEAVPPTCCNQTMNQVYSVPGLKFKGSGFYSTGG